MFCMRGFMLFGRDYGFREVLCRTDYLEISSMVHRRQSGNTIIESDSVHLNQEL
ncbi:uncharacterized protein DS421_16g534750 [Arachis hypogaea]|nr:uncharacterized protein DS421_16g534750 [Arachis hypogaea]